MINVSRTQNYLIALKVVDTKQSKQLPLSETYTDVLQVLNHIQTATYYE